MGDENEYVVLYDETSPLEQTRRSILQYRPTPEVEATTYLVELPEKHIDAPRPSTRPARRSTIVNTLQWPETREAEEQPLEEYVRRNLPSFRRSLTPEVLQELQQQAQQRYQEGEVVLPVTAADIERDTMDNKKRSNSGTGSEKREKQRDTYQNQRVSEPKTNNHKSHNKLEDSQSSKADKKQRKYDNKNDLHHPRNEVIVMPALEPISTSNKSPFYKDPKNKRRDDNLFSPIKVKLAVVSSDEELSGEEKRGSKQRSKGGKSVPSSGKRRSSKESSEYSLDEADDLIKKSHKNNKYCQKSAKRGRNESRGSSRSSDDEHRRRKYDGKAIHPRSISVCLSGESGENSSEPNMVNSASKREKRSPNNIANKSRPPSAKDRITGEKPSNRDKKRSSQSSAKRGRQSEEIVDYNQTTNPFGKQDPYSVHFVATKKGEKKVDKSADKNKKQKAAGSKEKSGGEDPNKNMMVKAPRSATKVVAKRRYHIQIPEHGRPETWFNVRFNMNAQNNVDMNYEGPVKINNYYASNNYS